MHADSKVFVNFALLIEKISPKVPSALRAKSDSAPLGATEFWENKNYERARKFTDKFYIDKDVIDRSCTRVHVYLGKRISSNGNVNVSLEY